MFELTNRRAFKGTLLVDSQLEKINSWLANQEAQTVSCQPIILCSPNAQTTSIKTFFKA